MVLCIVLVLNVGLCILMSAVVWLIVGLLCFSKIVMSDHAKLKSVDFEIFGNVQGRCKTNKE